MIAFSIVQERLWCPMPPRLDTTTCLALQEPLLERVRTEQRPVVFDLTGVTFVCSMFIRLCMQIYKQQGAERFELVNLAPDVKKVFKIAGLDQLLRID